FGSGQPNTTDNSGYGNSTPPSVYQPNGTRTWNVVAPGTNFAANATVPAWTPGKVHQCQGNVLIADGHVDPYSSSGLRKALAVTGDVNPSPNGPNLLLFP